MNTGARLAPVLLVNFIGTLGFTIVLPFLVFLVNDLGGNAVIYGAVGACYSAFQFVGAPILGRWSDRFGRRRILLLSQAGTLLAWVLFGVALLLPRIPLVAQEDGLLGTFTLTLPLAVIFVARAIDGLTGGNISVANAYVADISTDEDRDVNFGRMGVAANLGMVLGPAIASLIGLTPYAISGPIAASALVSVLALVVIAFRLPESKRKPKTATLRTGSASLGHEPRDCAKAAKRSALELPGVRPWITTYFLIFLAFNLFYAAFPMHAAVGLEWSVSETGVFFSGLSIVLVIVEGPVLSWLTKRTRARTRIAGGLALLVASLGLFAVSSSAAAYAGAVLYACGNGIMWPTLVARIAKVGGSEHQGAVQGAAGSAGSAASVLGLLVGGGLYALFGAGSFFVAGATMGLGWLSTRFLPDLDEALPEAG
ncbi:MAG: MFS transporter [Myxococcota bacterium]